MTRLEPGTPSPGASWATSRVSARTDREAMRQAVVFGAVMASFNVEMFSLERLRTLTFAEVTLRYQEFQQLTRFDSFSPESLGRSE